MKTTILFTNCVHRSRSVLLLVSLLVGCFVVLPTAEAVNPPPDGGYPGGNTAEGTDALFSLTSGVWNTALGAWALNHDTTGHQNTATGYQSLFSNTIGGQNTASGVWSLFSNLDGLENTATGYQSLFSNTIGGQNTASGAWSLFSNLYGQFNTADGYKALAQNISGGANSAVGAQALWRNTSGSANTAMGAGALTHNTTAERNTAMGSNVLEHNRTGSSNTATGYAALDRNTTGDSNTAIGDLALYNTFGNSNTAIGSRAGQNVITASNVTCLGASVAGANVSNTTWIGNVYGVTTQSGTTAPVIVSDTGQLGTAASSERFKKDITTMDKASEVIMGLRPVTFHYKSDAKETPQFGLIAEEVAKVNPALVLPDKEGKPYTVRYDQVNAMLLNEFLKEHRTMQELKSNAAKQEATIARQQKQIEALTAGLQKVSAQVEMTIEVPQVVDNRQ
jgi:trimeric autotransporter adhesin